MSPPGRHGGARRRRGARGEVEGVVVQVVTADGVDALARRLRLELLKHGVPDAEPRGADGPAPHLEHPSEGGVGGAYARKEVPVLN